MSRLLYIRHAQASFLKENYDQLSDLGYRQSAVLGKYLVQTGLMPDKIYIGPLQRHWQTYEKVREVYLEQGIPLPEPILLDGLREHQGMEVMARVLPQLVERYVHARQWLKAAEADPATKRKNHLRIFTWFMQEWAADRLDIDHPDDLEPWSVFRENVRQGMEQIISDKEKGLTVAAFTSGGTIAASLGYVLEMTKEERVVELNGKVKNTSISSFLFSEGKVSLQSFNEVPHLVEKSLITYV